jgi:hypothetical protein
MRWLRLVALLLPLAVAGCAGSEVDTAMDQASDDLGCPRSKIKLLDESHSPAGDAPDRFRFFACGEEVVYECGYRGVRQNRHWGCQRSGYRFPA